MFTKLLYGNKNVQILHILIEDAARELLKGHCMCLCNNFVSGFMFTTTLWKWWNRECYFNFTGSKMSVEMGDSSKIL